MTSIAVIEPGPTGGPGAMGAVLVLEALRRAGHIATHLRLFGPSRRETSIPGVLFGGGIIDARSDELGHDALFVSTIYTRQWIHLPAALEACGVRPMREERTSSDPLVAIGGQMMLAPSPITPFADVVALGDGEVTAVRIADMIHAGVPKDEIRATLSGQPGYWVPGLDEPPSTLRRAEVSTIPVRLLRTGASGSPTIELARGCKSRCAFCPIGWAGGSYREADKTEVADIVQSARGTGLNAYAPDYSSLSWVDDLESTMTTASCHPRGRDARMDATRRLVSRGGQQAGKTWSFGLEGISERLRRAIGKPLRNNQIVEGMTELAQAGCKGVKWYFILGLPGEDESDLQELLAVLDETRKVWTSRLDLTLTLLQPVPHTPLQWDDGHFSEAAYDRGMAIRRHLAAAHSADGLIWIASQPKSRSLHEHDTALSRADASAAGYLTALAGRKSRISDGRWTETADAAGWDWRGALPAITPGAAVPWSFVDVGVDQGRVLAARRRYGETMAASTAGVGESMGV